MVGGFPRDALFLIAGPCVLEDDNLNLRVGEALARMADHVPGGVFYKASFDKANRSNASAHRGPGMDDGLEKLARVRSATGLRLLTDVHLPEQCAPVAEVVDVLQIPAFLCRQTDLLEAAGATGRSVNIKKGQWMAPEAMKGAVEKIQQARPESRGQRSTHRASRLPNADRFSATAILPSTCARSCACSQLQAAPLCSTEHIRCSVRGLEKGARAVERGSSFPR